MAKNNGYKVNSSIEKRIPDACPGDAFQASSNMGVLVTPHVGISPDYKLLSCGVDSFDLSASVDWGDNPYHILSQLLSGRETAQGKDGSVVWEYFKDTDFEVLIYPTGKKMYRYHLEFKEAHVFISKSDNGKKFPNVYISIKSKTIWSLGIKDSVRIVREYLENMGGSVEYLKPSRVDLCADYQLPNGFCFDFLRVHGVPDDIYTAPIIKSRKLETFYIGSKKASIRARIYDKSKEVLVHSKEWFWDIWGIETPIDVWRIEFQIRRTALNAYGINTVDSLIEKLGGIWLDLSSNWYSLRLLDNKNTSRRTIHPFWQDLQSQAEKFGKMIEVKRSLKPGKKASYDYHIARAARHLLCYAAILSIPHIDKATEKFMADLLRYWENKDFKEERKKRVIELNKVFERLEVEHEDLPI